jgi:L-alanine-DL-glutamate epimerase-like enolase superfamily enzyme
LVEISSENGLNAFGHLAWYNPRSAAQIKSVKVLVDDLGQYLLGRDALERSSIYDAMRRLTMEALHEGIAMLAVGVIDIALWDLAAKFAGVPVSALLGRYRDGVAVYESGRLTKDGLAELAREAETVAAQGFHTVKVTAGARPLKEDVARIETIRRSLGAEKRLMVDCGRRLSPSAAVRFARAIADFDIYWLEDPVPQDDISGLRWVREHGELPIATGERISHFAELQAILAANAVDHIMLNLQRSGGPTAWLSLAAVLQHHNIPLSGHGGHDFQIHFLASQPHGNYSEYHSWWNGLYIDPPLPRDGMLKIRPEPGYGLTLDRQRIARCRVD